VRILATSNRDLVHIVEQGQFRQDLYYRLNVFPVSVPPLRDRPEDIQLLADHFLRRFARKHGVGVAGYADSALRAMMQYRWPGNVRELENAVERAVILAENGRLITAAALGLPSEPGQAGILFGSDLAVRENEETDSADVSAVSEHVASSIPVTNPDGTVLSIAELEKQAIRAALLRTEGNRTQAALLLGISIRTLRNKLQEYREAGTPVESAAGED
jgi:DNA-binding NtrC family response regulator